jgi:hypothetical protein
MCRPLTSAPSFTQADIAEQLKISEPSRIASATARLEDKSDGNNS